MVRAAGIEPAQAFRAYGFSYQLRLSPPRLGACALRLVCGLDYPFTVAFAAGDGHDIKRRRPSNYRASHSRTNSCHFRGWNISCRFCAHIGSVRHMGKGSFYPSWLGLDGRRPWCYGLSPYLRFGILSETRVHKVRPDRNITSRLFQSCRSPHCRWPPALIRISRFNDEIEQFIMLKKHL